MWCRLLAVPPEIFGSHLLVCGQPFCTVLWAAAACRPPGRGEYNASTSCALHRGGHREHCAALAVVTAPTPTCSCPESTSQSARHRWYTIQRCLCSPAVHFAGCKHSGFGAVETDSCPGRSQTRTLGRAKVTPRVPTENTSSVAVLGAPDDAKRDLRRATIRRASEPTTAYCDAFRKSIRKFLVPPERGVIELSPHRLVPREIALVPCLNRLAPSAIREE